MLPLPLPDVLLSVSHDASFDTVHDVFDVTVMLYELAEEPTDLLVGEIESVGATPDCVTVHTCGEQPAALNVILPVRGDVEVFSNTKTATLSLPLPESVVPINHNTSAATDHDVSDVTLMLFQLAGAATFIVIGETDNE